jgi:hypothetical protein
VKPVVVLVEANVARPLCTAVLTAVVESNTSSL